MQAEASGQIEVGDALVAVNGVPVATHLSPQLLADHLSRVGRPVHVAFHKCQPSSTLAQPPPPPAPLVRPSASGGTNNGTGKGPINNSSGDGGGMSDEGWAASLRSAAAAAAADSMDPEVYAAAAAAASHMGSLALAGLGAAGVMHASSSSSRLPHDRSGSPGLLALDDDLSNSMGSSQYAESGGGGLQGDDVKGGEKDWVTHTEDGFALPRLLGECYSASLNGVQMEAFYRARLGDGGLQRTWVRGQVT